MASLYNLIAKLPERNWNYYFPINNDNPISKPVVTNETSIKFIRRYFTKAGKEYLMNEFDIYNFSKTRADHTVSIFFFGLFLYHNTHLKDEVFTTDIHSEKYELFHFIWFVTCLSHDLAFDKERDNKLIERCSNLENFKRHFGIEHDLTSTPVANVPSELLHSVENYYNYRHHNERCDHGIHAGIFMYDRLVRNRRLMSGNKHEDLNWEEWLEPLYAYASATVEVHNIFLPGLENVEQYHQFGLTALIDRAEKKVKIRFSDAPLLFILGLVDTLDPVKAYRDLEPAYVLKNIFLTFQGKDRFKIIVSNRLCFSNMQRQVESLNLWLDVKASIKGRTIQFVI